MLKSPSLYYRNSKKHIKTILKLFPKGNLKISSKYIVDVKWTILNLLTYEQINNKNSLLVFLC